MSSGLAILNAERLKNDSGENVPTGEVKNETTVAPTATESVRTFYHTASGELEDLFGTEPIWEKVEVPLADESNPGDAEPHAEYGDGAKAAATVAETNENEGNTTVNSTAPTPTPTRSTPTFTDTLRGELSKAQSSVNR